MPEDGRESGRGEVPDRMSIRGEAGPLGRCVRTEGQRDELEGEGEAVDSLESRFADEARFPHVDHRVETELSRR